MCEHLRFCDQPPLNLNGGNNGIFIDLGGNTLEDECTPEPEPCPADLNGDGNVDSGDLGLLIAAWNTADASADINGDGNVDSGDLGLLISAPGPPSRSRDRPRWVSSPSRDACRPIEIGRHAHSRPMRVVPRCPDKRRRKILADARRT